MTGTGLRAHRWLLAAFASLGCAVVYGCATGVETGAVATDDCVVGSEGCPCTPGGACDPGLTCLSDFCVDVGESSGGSPTGGSGGASNSGAGGESTAASTSGGTTSGSASTTGGTTVSSSSVASSSSSGGNCSVPAPTNVQGCATCGATCDAPWDVTWTAVSAATHYMVEYQCFLGTSSYQTSNTEADLCTEVGMCNDSSCANGVGTVTVSACDGTCCSAGTLVPASESPIACGGGVCC